MTSGSKSVLTLLIITTSLSGVSAADAGRGLSNTSLAQPPAVRACSLLTKELIAQVTPYERQQLAPVTQIPPMEDALPRGSACSYGGITLQIDPFPPATLEKQRTPAWSAVPGVGDEAYFRDNRGEWGELYVRAGARVLTIQMDVPTGRTAAAIQPNTIALAKALLPKLK
jgi:hypothetical protein